MLNRTADVKTKQSLKQGQSSSRVVVALKSDESVATAPSSPCLQDSGYSSVLEDYCSFPKSEYLSIDATSLGGGAMTNGCDHLHSLSIHPR
ncbi:hypothetical protein M514_15417 [Trichuris suis]|uniref:Uncharacterized protein n=1 Tax=Trichuris suis TaxID=68888 RepID=A0A085NSY5_9BILA|nr:hypothetical protein M514_15417 [Trichuris suis]